MKALTQFEDRRGTDNLDVVIGFDFGTSCTKVVVRAPYAPGERAYAVPFSDAAHKSSDYLLPSVLWIGPGGRTSLTPISPGQHLRDIKFHLMQGKRLHPTNGGAPNEGYSPNVIAVAFVAMALRRAREWFIREQRPLYGNYTIKWALNIGLPSAQYADKLLHEPYRELANAAWWLSTHSAPITIETAQAALESPEKWPALADKDAAEIEMIPEVAAEVHGYARSNLRDYGLHILIDVGASTLDACSFVLHEDKHEVHLEVLTAHVWPLGTMSLYKSRVESVRNAVADHVRQLWDNCDPVAPLPDDMFPANSAIATTIGISDTGHRKECRQKMWQTIIDLKTKRDPRARRPGSSRVQLSELDSPRAWRDEVPLFLTGGASVMEFYKLAIDEMSTELSKLYRESPGLRRLALEKPGNLVAGVTNHDYHRFAVAWGLSYPAEDMGSIARPSEIEDVSPPQVNDWQINEITKDMV